MEELLSDVLSDGWAHDLFLLALAYALALPLAIDRERRSSSAGLRTFPLVALASCGFLISGSNAMGPEISDNALARLQYGLMNGIGFIGGGAIFRSDDAVEGTATASAIWCTGAIGAAVANEQFVIACALSAASALTFIFGHRFKRDVRWIRQKPDSDPGTPDA